MRKKNHFSRTHFPVSRLKSLTISSTLLAVLVLSLGMLVVAALPAGAQTKVASLEHDTVNGTFNSLVQVDSDTYALAYAGDGIDGFITTFSILTTGTLSWEKRDESDLLQGGASFSISPNPFTGSGTLAMHLGPTYP